MGVGLPLGARGSPPRARSFRSVLRFWLGYAAYLAGICVLLLYGFFAVNRARYRKHQRPLTERPVAATHLSAETAGRLGFVGQAREGTFQRAALVKPPGTIRIGCFGDSFTYGDEAAAGFDFPSLLGAIARRSGRSDVEVLNFGTSWYGFHQAYLMWQEVGRPLGVDTVVLGPDCFRPERDTTFCHAGAASPYYLHARYVLDGEGVRLEEVAGETFQERFDAYYRFLPRWRYLRYDSNPPLVLAGLVGPSRVLPNPVYYQYHRLTRNQEAAETYQRLLHLGASADLKTPVLLGQLSEGGFRLPDGPNLAVRTLVRPDSFPYLAAASHLGPLGNDLVARQYWALLNGETEVVLPWVRFGEVPADLPSTTPISLEGRLIAEMDGRAVGELRDVDLAGGDAGPTDLAGVAALLILAPEGVDGPWLALRSAPSEGSRVTVTVGLETEAGVRSLDLGAPKAVGTGTGVWRLPAGALSWLESSPAPRGASVTIDGVEVLLGAPEPGPAPGLRLRPVKGRLKRLRALPDGFLPLDVGRPGGTLALRCGERRVVVASWRLEPRSVPFVAPPFRAIP